MGHRRRPEPTPQGSPTTSLLRTLTHEPCMKWLTYLRDGCARQALVDGEHAIDVHDAQPEISVDLRSALRAGVDFRALANTLLRSSATRLPLAQLTYAPLIPEPGKIICLGLN